MSSAERKTKSSAGEKRTLSFSPRPPHAPYLDSTIELGYCLEFLAAQMSREEAYAHFHDLLKIIANIWQEPSSGSPGPGGCLAAEAAATRDYVRRKVYSLQLGKDALAYSADPFRGWQIRCYKESESNLSLERKMPEIIEGQNIPALLDRLVKLPSGKEKDVLLAALGDYASILWRAYINTTDYRTPSEINWALLRAAYEHEVAIMDTASFDYLEHYEDNYASKSVGRRNRQALMGWPSDFSDFEE